MAKKANSLAHTKWMCKYHIVFTPKYRRKIVYNQYKESIRDIIKQLRGYKGVEIIEGHLMPDHVHMLVSIPPKISVSSFMGYLKGKSALMIFDKHANLKYKFGNRHFWAEGTVFGFTGLDDGTYVLRETKTPDGYNSIEDKTFTISAKHDENSDDPKLTELTGNPASGSVIDFGVIMPEKGELSTDVENNKGSVLPSTGGAGRVAIYVIGAILVLGGGIVLVTKKRVR